jgi:hypothetical protein
MIGSKQSKNLEKIYLQTLANSNSSHKPQSPSIPSSSPSKTDGPAERKTAREEKVCCSATFLTLIKTVCKKAGRRSNRFDLSQLAGERIPFSPPGETPPAEGVGVQLRKAKAEATGSAQRVQQQLSPRCGG